MNKLEARAVWTAIGLGILAFEIVAALFIPGGTLSDQAWAFVGLGEAAWMAGLGAFVGGAAILVWHFFFGGREP